jgi:1-acyl-sn-glycerol-3-phosphate acyltransferase
MDNRTPNMPVSLFRGGRLALHLFYGMLLAIFYPHLSRNRQRRILKVWSRQLLDILNIGIRTDGQLPAPGAGGCMIVANHVSWLDIFVLNAIYPSRFIAKADVRNWPLIGWLCKRGDTIFIERDLRRHAAPVNQHIGALLKQGDCVGLFPEGTTTDGKQVGHFHSALIQPAINAGAMLYPVALRYQDDTGRPGDAAAFIGDTTLVQSIWRILRCRHLDASLAFTPGLPAANANRRMLARTAQETVAQALQQALGQPAIHVISQAPRLAQSAPDLLPDYPHQTAVS